MGTTLKLEGAFDYPFDSLKTVGKISSEDKKIRVFTWNIILADGYTGYFGFIMHKPGKDVVLHSLKDSDSASADPFNAVYDGKNWCGSLIYDIIDVKISGETLYTLLTYDPADLFIKRKMVDILWFRDGLPVFGMPVFRYQNRIQNRMIFEYSAKVQMSLTYNEDKHMIVFDHLVPTNQSLTGKYQYYVPDLSFNGLKLEKGIWEYVENVDVRN
jgi:hypothetical protein